MVKKDYVPDRGDLVWLNFTPQAGHEQMGRRPAFVLSPKEYNRKTNLFIVCPITSHKKGYPFEVAIEAKKIGGMALSDQVKSLDWTVREVEFIEKGKVHVLAAVMDNIKALLLVEE